MKINIPVRLKNPVFWAQVVLGAFATALAYAGVTGAEMTSWGAVWEIVRGTYTNPYCLFMVLCNVWNAVNDPTTSGLTDSTRALGYIEPSKE